MSNMHNATYCVAHLSTLHLQVQHNIVFSSFFQYSFPLSCSLANFGRSFTALCILKFMRIESNDYLLSLLHAIAIVHEMDGQLITVLSASLDRSTSNDGCRL